MTRRPWLLVALWSVVILIGTSLPPRHLPRIGMGRDKLAHLAVYAVLGALLANALRREHPARGFLLLFLMSLGGAAVFGAADEWHQRLLQRSCCWDDWLADVIGAAAGAALMLICRGQRMGGRTMSEARRISAQELEAEVARDQPCVVEFWMTGCAACARFGPTFGELAQEFEGRANLVTIEARENMETSQKYAIRGVPTIIAFRGGQEVQRTTGAKTLEEMRDWLEPVLS